MRGTFSKEKVQDFNEVLMTPNDGAVKKPYIQEEVGTFLLNAVDEWL